MCPTLRTMPSQARNGRYHHGDLRAALIGTAIEIIAERGVRGFSVAEASRRLGVAVSAPYAHFADRDGLRRPSRCMPMSSSTRNWCQG